MNPNYFTRQTGLANPENLTKDIGIIGAGTIGSWTAYTLLKMGCQKVCVYDFDNVEEGNVGSQIYTSTDIGKLKTEALKEKLALLTEGRLETEEANITREAIPTSLFDKDIIILAVDNIETRKILFEVALWAELKSIFIDARMAGNAIEIYTIPLTDSEKVEYYKTTLFEPAEASPVLCSERSVVYNVFVVAGLLTDIVAQLSRGETPPKELVVDLQNFTLFGGLK